MFEHWICTDLQQLPEVRKLSTMFTGDSAANRIGVIVTDGGDEITLTGNVVASIVRPDGVTITQNGAKSGNRAWVDLPSGAYAVPGQMGVFLKLVNGNDVATLGGVECYVYKG